MEKINSLTTNILEISAQTNLLALTDGRINIEVYHGDSLGTEGEQLKQISVGGIDFARISSGQLANYEDKFKAFQALYLYKNEDEMWKALDGSVGDEFLNSQNLLSNNIQGLSWFSGSSRNFYNDQKEVHSPEDLKGLTLRVNTDPMFALLVNAGAEGINIAYNDIVSSIKAGKINGAENNWASYIFIEHYKYSKYITLDQHTFIPELLVASKSMMESLSEEDQKIIEECAQEVSDYQIKEMKKYDDAAMKQAQKEGVVVTSLTDAEIAEFQKAGEKVNKELFADYQDVIARITP